MNERIWWGCFLRSFVLAFLGGKRVLLRAMGAWRYSMMTRLWQRTFRLRGPRRALLFQTSVSERPERGDGSRRGGRTARQVRGSNAWMNTERA